MMFLALQTSAAAVEAKAPVPPRIDIPAGQILLGRQAEVSDVHLASVNISRKHARMEMQQGKLSVTDLKSMHGVYVNGKRLSPHVQCALHLGDIVVFGDAAKSPFVYAVVETKEATLKRKREEASAAQVKAEQEARIQRLVKKNQELEAAAQKEQERVKQVEREAHEAKRRVEEERVKAEAERAALEERNEKLLFDQARERKRLLELESKQKEVEAKSAQAAEHGDVIESLNEELSCCICRELMVLAHALTCSHTFCLECITDWRKKSSTCPECRAPAVGAAVPVRTLDNAIDKVASTLPDDEQKERMERLAEARKIQQKDTANAVGTVAAPARQYGFGTDDYDESSEDSEESEGEWWVENARSGRSTCRTCGRLIAHGSRRWAHRSAPEWGYESTVFHHYACVGR